MIFSRLWHNVPITWGGTLPDSWKCDWQILCSVWEEAHTSVKFILLTSPPWQLDRYLLLLCDVLYYFYQTIEVQKALHKCSFFFCLHIHLISKNEEQHGFVHSTQWKKLWWNIFSSYQMTEVWHKITVNQSAHDLNMKKSLYVLLKTQLCQIVFLWDLHFPTVKLKPSNNL